jgi:hypothetical protein
MPWVRTEAWRGGYSVHKTRRSKEHDQCYIEDLHGEV